MTSSDFREQVSIGFLKNTGVAKALVFILIISSAAFLFLLWLLYFREGFETYPDYVRRLPAINALFNTIATVFLILGYISVRRKNYRNHMRYMLAAFIASCLFLVSYVIYHNFVGHTPFPGSGWIRPLYFTILISHILLSAAVVPLILSSFYFAFSGKFATHRRLSKITLPVWLYVSLTGVAIFFILKAYS
jgi:putative membrane protein